MKTTAPQPQPRSTVKCVCTAYGPLNTKMAFLKTKPRYQNMYILLFVLVDINRKLELLKKYQRNAWAPWTWFLPPLPSSAGGIAELLILLNFSCASAHVNQSSEERANFDLQHHFRGRFDALKGPAQSFVLAISVYSRSILMLIGHISLA